MRAEPGGPPEAVLVLGTEGAPTRRLLRGRRSRPVEHADPEPVPTARVTVVWPDPFPSAGAAAAWLGGLRDDGDAATAELGAALATLNRALRARRAATADPYVTEVSAAHALVARVGYGGGEAVAEGSYGEALELAPAGARRPRRSMEAPEERFAALLGGHERPLVAEELVLRARADLNASRPREAALQARVALEALLAELPEAGAPLAEHRPGVGRAANAALSGHLGEHDLQAVTEAVERMEAALRRHRVGG